MKIYTSDTCPKCKMLKTALTEAGIEFEESQDYTSKGILQLPMLEINEDVIYPFELAMMWIKKNKSN